MALHKTNMYIDISGWSPRGSRRSIPRMRAGCRGSSCGAAIPVPHAGALPRELSAWGCPGHAEHVMRGNAERILGLS